VEFSGIYRAASSRPTTIPNAAILARKPSLFNRFYPEAIDQSQGWMAVNPYGRKRLQPFTQRGNSPR
jgi:hypothetical protein